MINRRLDYLRSKSILRIWMDINEYNRRVWFIFSDEREDGTDDLAFKSADDMSIEEIKAVVEDPCYRGYMRSK